MTLAAIVLLTGCARREPRFVIGVSQCSQDIWRDKLNSELRMGAYSHDDIELRFASADDSDELQISQIEQFVSEGIDLLIVAPNQVSTVTPVIDRVFDSGIPVIVFDRKTNTEKFTAYIGADNREMGRMMGEFIAAQLGGRGRVVAGHRAPRGLRRGTGPLSRPGARRLAAGRLDGGERLRGDTEV